MKISRELPQFEGLPALFITSGEYEAIFYVAHMGEINLKESLRMSPRDEAKEKQAFTGHKAGMKDLTSVSHHGNYIEDLKMRFARSVHKIIHDLIAEYKLEEIYLFAPKYVTVRIMNGLENEDKKKIRMQFYKEYTKESPLKLVEIFDAEVAEIQKTIMQNPEKNSILLP